MNPKVIKALDVVIAGLEELKEALEASATKSGSAAYDGTAGKVSGPKGKARAAELPASRSKSRPAPDDDAGVDEDDDDDSTDADELDQSDDTGDTDDEDDIPPPTAAKAGKQTVKQAAAPAAKAAPAKAAKAAKPAASAAPDIEAVREKLTAVITTEGLGRKKALDILGKFGANSSAELSEDDYPAVIRACDKAIAGAQGV